MLGDTTTGAAALPSEENSPVQQDGVGANGVARTVTPSPQTMGPHAPIPPRRYIREATARARAIAMAGQLRPDARSALCHGRKGTWVAPQALTAWSTSRGVWRRVANVGNSGTGVHLVEQRVWHCQSRP